MPYKPHAKKRPWEPKKDNRPHARRLKPNSEFYNSRQWRKVRALYLQSHPFCECDECKSGIPLPADTVDHIIPINKGGDPWAETNFQAMNHRCHNKKSGREAHS